MANSFVDLTDKRLKRDLQSQRESKMMQGVRARFKSSLHREKFLRLCDRKKLIS
ncbi:hypothetical protein [Scytonema sp. NUACC21]